jgi:hypothetical protein
MARTAVVAGTATAVVGHSQKKQAAAANAQAADQAAFESQAQMADMQQQMAAMQAQQAAAPAAAPAAADPMAELQKLADMKAQGLLTDEEFTAAKAKLLA